MSDKATWHGSGQIARAAAQHRAREISGCVVYAAAPGFEAGSDPLLGYWSKPTALIGPSDVVVESETPTAGMTSGAMWALIVIVAVGILFVGISINNLTREQAKQTRLRQQMYYRSIPTYEEQLRAQMDQRRERRVLDKLDSALSYAERERSRREMEAARLRWELQSKQYEEWRNR